MEIMVLDHNDDVEMLRELGNEWKSLAHGLDYGLPLEVNIWLNTMRNLKHRSDGDVLILVDAVGSVRGSLGMTYRLNHVGPGLIANECTFFVSPSARGGGLKLIHAAEKLARIKGCAFATFNASSIAGDAARSGRLYQHCGYSAFESAYLKVL
ncbi:MAG: hypothetical protein H7Y05_14210 [Steroidobacteraceae bacterium]|nr:hypothetical protein [Deltaproteobacteria bacterium]